MKNEFRYFLFCILTINSFSQQIEFSKDIVLGAELGFSDSVSLISYSSEPMTLDSIAVIDSPCENGFNGHVSFYINIPDSIRPFTSIWFQIGPIPIWGTDNPTFELEPLDTALLYNFSIGQTDWDSIQCTMNGGQDSPSYLDTVLFKFEFIFSNNEPDTLTYKGRFDYLYVDDVIEKPGRNTKIRLTKNPENLFLTGLKPGDQINIINLTGKLLLQEIAEKNSFTTTTLKDGIKFIFIKDDHGKIIFNEMFF